MKINLNQLDIEDIIELEEQIEEEQIKEQKKKKLNKITKKIKPHQ